jgi:hypothetical protein
MPTLQQKISHKFLERLSNFPDADQKKIEKLRALFASGKKVKAEELVAIFSPPANGDSK